MGFNSGFKGLSCQAYFKLFVPCIFSTYGIKTNWCHYFIRILPDLYMFRAHRPHLQESSYSCSHNHWFNFCAALFAWQHTEHANRAAQILNQWLCEQLYNSPEVGPVGPKRVEIRQYTNKIVTSVGFYSICWKDARYKKLKKKRNLFINYY